MDEDERRAIALFRFSVLGPLVSARLDHGDRVTLFESAARRDHVTPGGRVVRVSARTVESWYYSYRKAGLEGLMPHPRKDCGTSRSMTAEVRDLVIRAKQEHPRRSIRRIIRMLERAKVVRVGELSSSSVHRLLEREGISARPSRRESELGEVSGTRVERRSFIAAHVGDLWIGDALHVHRPVRFPCGRVGKAYLLSQIDNASRYMAHSYVAGNERASDQERGLKQAVLKYGLPRVYYVDRGPAYTARSLKAICGDLGARLLHADAGDAEAKGTIERWHRTWREEVEDELPAGVISIEDLSAFHFAWLTREYHVRVHDTTRQPPRERFFAEVNELLPAPPPAKLDQLFLHREKRRVRKDGTVRWAGGFLEVRPELVGKQVQLRFDPNDDTRLPKVYLNGTFVCDTVPLDRVANMYRRRRTVTGEPAPDVVHTGIDPLQQLVDEHTLATRIAHLAHKTDDEPDEED